MNSLYGGYFYLKQKNDSFVNLSSRVLNADEVDFLNLGINCHVESKFKVEDKYAEVELLFQQITQLEKDKKVTVDHEIKPALLTEASKCRSVRVQRKKLLSQRLVKALRVFVMMIASLSVGQIKLQFM